MTPGRQVTLIDIENFATMLWDDSFRTCAVVQAESMLDKLTYDAMREFVGTPFTIDLGERSCELVLTHAAKVMESEAARLARNPFSLHFTGPAEPFLPQHTYPMHHEKLGTLEIFLVPIGRTAGGFTYEAVFT